MKKKPEKKMSKPRRPLYYVDNPNKLELKWLDDIQKKPDTGPISVHGSAAAAEPIMPAHGGVRQGRVNSKTGKQSVFNAQAERKQQLELLEQPASELISSPQETEEIVAVATSVSPAIELPEEVSLADVESIMESSQNETELAADAIAEILREETAEQTEVEQLAAAEAEQVAAAEAADERELRASKLEEKRMPSKPAPLVYTDDLADEAVTSEKIASLAVKAAHLASDSIHTAALADYAVTSIKLADGSITSSKIAPESIVGDHLTKKFDFRTKKFATDPSPARSSRMAA
ncbi:hypothetical protein [Cohnella kolymensis]|nr:hypothetical protein [Cohnella kolymensis]